MATLSDLESFHGFATRQLSGGTDHSLEELLTQWRERTERDKANEGIRRGLAAFEDGRHRPVEEFLDEVRSANQ